MSNQRAGTLCYFAAVEVMLTENFSEHYEVALVLDDEAHLFLSSNYRQHKN